MTPSASPAREIGVFDALSPWPDLELGLNLFRHETLDQIRQQNHLVYAEPENVGRQVGQGGELETRWAPARDLLLRGWYAYQYNADETTGGVGRNLAAAGPAPGRPDLLWIDRGALLSEAAGGRSGLPGAASACNRLALSHAGALDGADCGSDDGVCRP